MKWGLYALLSFGLWSGLALGDEGRGTYFINVSGANLRLDPSTHHSPVMLTIPHGAPVQVLGASGDWYQVRYGKHVGYVRADLMSQKQDPNATTTESAPGAPTPHPYPVAPAPRPPNKGHLLFVGDSITCGSYGLQQYKDLTARGYDVTMFCSVGSTPKTWIGGAFPKKWPCMMRSAMHPDLTRCPSDLNFKSILANYPGVPVVTALGTNSLGGLPDSYYSNMITEMNANQSACVWVGPPHLRPDQAAAGFTKADLQNKENGLENFYPSLAKHVSPPCGIVDSRDDTYGRETQDGVHPTKQGGVLWADATTDKILNKFVQRPAPGLVPDTDTAQ